MVVSRVGMVVENASRVDKNVNPPSGTLTEAFLSIGDSAKVG